MLDAPKKNSLLTGVQKAVWEVFMLICVADFIEIFALLWVPGDSVKCALHTVASGCIFYT